MPASDKPRISPAKLALAVRRLRAEKEDLDLIASDPIAVVGMGCRFPGGGNSPEEFWTALKEGCDGVSEVPEGRWKDAAELPLQLRRGAYLPEIDGFDAAFFGISPREAQLMDPQQRLLLEVTWEALWDAGIDPASLAGTDAGAFIAIYNSDYARLHFRDTSALTAHGGIGSAHSVAAGRLSFLLNLKGPSLAIDSACSSSLVATHLACQSLRSRECGFAIVGASSLKTLSDEVIVFSKWGMLASDGKCKAFDASADGFVPGEGSGVVILKRLSDALQDGDRVRAVIRGTAVNHDGKTTVLTAPNGLAQEALFRAALSNAMLAPGDISYIETHGTGTSLGDPIEIEAVSAVYGQPGTGAPPCILGAVKTNLGHLEAAAGIAGIIKTVLCLEHGEIPRNLHFHRLNPEISLTGTRLKISAENTPWARGEKPRTAGVSSFGLGGTNGHVILEEAPLLPTQNAASGRTIPLPAYAWKRERFWLAEVLTAKRIDQEATPARVPADGLVHPLLGKQIESVFIQGKLFESELDTFADSYLADHTLGYRPILPFAAFLEIAAAALRQIDKSGSSIRNLVVRDPLFLSSGGCRLQVLVTDGSIEMASVSGTRWTTHTKGSVQPSDRGIPIVDLAGLQASCQKEISANDIYDILERTGLRYGTAFRTIQAVWSGKGESLARLRLSEEAAREAQQYGLHPTLLDGCLQTVIAAREESNADLFLPISVDHFELLQTGKTEVWVHVKVVASSAEAFSADIVVMDASGSVVARLVGFQAKRANAVTLNQAAFSDSAPMYELAWRPAPLVAGVRSSRSGEHWLLIESQEGSCSHLVDLLEQQGGKCDVLVRGAQSLHSIIAKVAWSGIVYDARGSENPGDASEWTHPEKNDVEFVLEFVKFLGIPNDAVAPRIWIVSSASAAVLPSESVSIAQSPLWGLARTLMLEHPETSPVLIDVGSEMGTVGASQEIAEMVAAEMAANGPEAMVAFRHGTRYIARLIPDLQRPEAAQRLRIDPSGRLEDLRIEATKRKEPQPHEVEIEVRASGLNFRDVLTALAMFPARTATPGAECAGTIVRVGSEVRGLQVGDAVLAFAPASLQTFVNLPADFVTRKPAALAFAEAAGIPIAFLTAEYGLHRLANLFAGQRILIHAAAGGLGLAAVQLAMRAGAEVFATAGHPDKRAFLAKLGVEHIFDSRSLSFRDEVLRVTGGVGVDVVLNSLAGEFIRASLDVVAEGGCFLEVGKRDLWSAEEVAALGKHIRYFPFDLGEVATDDPKLIAKMLSELMGRFSTGELQPLPTTLYSIEDAAQAFRTMAQARQIGKIVLGFDSANRGQTVRDAVSDGTVLITGGLGALGSQLARWLAGQGAKHIVLAGRSADDSGENSAVVELRNQGVDVTIERVDVASSSQLQRLLDDIRAARPPLRAVFHAAGVLHDSVLGKESWDSYCETTAPKIQGAWNLDRLTQHDPIRLMVFFSSAASVLGSPGQGSYAAGNAFLDALAHHRSSRGLATLSVNWGAWASSGMAARLTPEQSARWTRQGVIPMEPRAALAALQTAIEAGRSQVTVMDLDWEQFLSAGPARRDVAFFSELQSFEREHREQHRSDHVQPARRIVEELRSAPEFERKFLLSTHIKICARRVLGLRESAPITDSVALQDVGLDSLMALEMRNDLSQSLGITLAAGLLFDHPSIEELTQHLLGILAPSIESVAATTVPDDATGATIELQSITDAEAELLLIQELDRAGREKANA
ncbi:MAG: SDR family NAD(P)-dependent oxidoreductase [Terriglobia bacterium]|nr:SDR family NAD(P)-dependent oxidoreductase [Terriglobia bacterium]